MKGEAEKGWRHISASQVLEASETRAEATPRGAGESFWLNWCRVGGREVGPLKCNISE